MGATSALIQEVLDPVDVEGWQGDEDWVSPDMLIGRWEATRYMINIAWQENPQQLRDFIVGLPIGTQAEGTLQPTLEGADVDIVIRAIVNYFFPRGIEDDVIYGEISGVFKEFFPPTYYEPDATAPNIWSLSYPEVADQMLALLDFIVDIPEFQLK